MDTSSYTGTANVSCTLHALKLKNFIVTNVISTTATRHQCDFNNHNKGILPAVLRYRKKDFASDTECDAVDREAAVVRYAPVVMMMVMMMVMMVMMMVVVVVA
jgi:hypothetical protein